MHKQAHPHQPHNNLNAAFKWAIAFNAGYVFVKAGVGFAPDSLALLTDVAELSVAWGPALAAKRPVNPNNGFLENLSAELEEHFNIHYATFRIEPSLSACCLCSPHDHQQERRE